MASRHRRRRGDGDVVEWPLHVCFFFIFISFFFVFCLFYLGFRFVFAFWPANTKTCFVVSALTCSYLTPLPAPALFCFFFSFLPALKFLWFSEPIYVCLNGPTGAVLVALD